LENGEKRNELRPLTMEETSLMIESWFGRGIFEKMIGWQSKWRHLDISVRERRIILILTADRINGLDFFDALNFDGTVVRITWGRSQGITLVSVVCRLCCSIFIFGDKLWSMIKDRASKVLLDLDLRIRRSEKSSAAFCWHAKRNIFSKLTINLIMKTCGSGPWNPVFFEKFKVLSYDFWCDIGATNSCARSFNHHFLRNSFVWLWYS
jgi:hypothetical protein